MSYIRSFLNARVPDKYCCDIVGKLAGFIIDAEGTITEAVFIARPFLNSLLFNIHVHRYTIPQLICAYTRGFGNILSIFELSHVTGKQLLTIRKSFWEKPRSLGLYDSMGNLLSELNSSDMKDNQYIVQSFDSTDSVMYAQLCNPALSSEYGYFLKPDVFMFHDNMIHIPYYCSAFDNISNTLELVILSNSMISISPHAFSGLRSVKKICCNDGLRCVCNKAFSGVSNLELIDIPATVEHIGDRAFEGNNFAVLGTKPVIILRGTETRVAPFAFKNNCRATWIVFTPQDSYVWMNRQDFAFADIRVLESDMYSRSELYAGV